MNFRIPNNYNLLIVLMIVIPITFVIMYFMNNSSGPKELKPKHLSDILSVVEQAALIRQIVKDSLQEILASKTLSVVSYTKEKTNTKALNIVHEIFHRNLSLDENHSIRISHMKPFAIQVTLEERQLMYHLLEVFDKTMKKHNTTFFMCSGTLLGSFRHHDLIPWDDDIDLFVPAKNRKDMENIFKPLSPDYNLIRAGGHDKFYHKTGKKASEYEWLWPYVDINYYEENDTHIIDVAKVYGSIFSIQKLLVFPLHNRPILNLSLPAPKDTFAYLVREYEYGSKCVMFGYSHMLEGSGPSGEINCTTLVDKFPFVDHLPHENGVREVLKYKTLVISDIVMPEPKYAVSETFQLSLKPGFEMPKEIKELLDDNIL